MPARIPGESTLLIATGDNRVHVQLLSKSVGDSSKTRNANSIWLSYPIPSYVH